MLVLALSLLSLCYGGGGRFVTAVEEDSNSTSTYKDYEGYQLIQIVPKSAEEFHVLTALSSELNEQLDFWKEPSPAAFRQRDPSSQNETTVVRATGPASTAVEILVSQEQKAKILDHLRNNSISDANVKVLIENIGEIVRDDAPTVPPEGAAADSRQIGQFNLNQYHSHQEIMSYLQQIAGTKREFVELRSIGSSYEGRDLAFLKIGYPSSQPKNVFFVDAGIHAREWITPAMALHFIDRLVNDESLRTLLEVIDVYVLPSLNPDGYEYSRRKDRLWRKSRTGPRGSSNCYGVDLNRNFPFYWAYSGVSHDPCSEIYCGPSELSENESRALTKFLLANNKTIKAYITLHSYGNLLIHPWGHAENSYPADIDEVFDAGVDVANAIKKAGGPQFTVGAGPQILYEVAGSSQDYAKSVGVKYTYTMELTNTWTGFVLPRQQIQPTADYVVPGLLVFADRVRKSPLVLK